MHARHYSPALGRFVQPDPDRSEANLYAYAANNPVTEMDPDGTCFIVCQLIVGAVIDSVVYFATTENASLGGLAKAVVGGAVESAIGDGGQFLEVQDREFRMPRRHDHVVVLAHPGQATILVAERGDLGLEQAGDPE
jgi:uncharacterized protein RhaS with RHS repeats